MCGQWNMLHTFPLHGHHLVRPRPIVCDVCVCGHCDVLMWVEFETVDGKPPTSSGARSTGLAWRVCMRKLTFEANDATDDGASTPNKGLGNAQPQGLWYTRDYSSQRDAPESPSPQRKKGRIRRRDVDGVVLRPDPGDVTLELAHHSARALQSSQSPPATRCMGVGLLVPLVQVRGRVCVWLP